MNPASAIKPDDSPASRPERQDHRGWRHAVFCTLALLISCSAARAQRLNLDAPAAPPPGATDSTRAMKSSLTGAKTGTPTDELPDAELGALARARTQALAVALITKGEKLGAPGSAHITLAMTLLADMAWPSEIGVRAASPGGEIHAAALRLYIRDIDKLGLNNGAAASSLPDTAAELDVLLRGVFAPLTELLRPAADPLKSGWAAADLARAAPSIDDLRAGVRDANPQWLDEATRTAVFDLLAVVEEAGTSWPFVAAAMDARATLGGAVPMLRAGLPAWFPETRRAQLLGHTAAALHAYAATTRDDEAAAVLALAASTMRICDWAEGLEKIPGQNARDVQSVRLAVADAAADATGPPGAARDRARKAVRSLERVLDLIDERPTYGTDGDVAQSLRTSFRALDAAAKKSESQLVAQLAAIARAEAASSQPAIVSVIAAHRRSLDDLRMLRLVDDLLTRHRDDQSPTWRLVSSRLTRMGQEVSRPATMETSLLGLRAFAAAMELQEPFAGEPSIRATAAKDAAQPLWDAESIVSLTRNQAAAVSARIDELRAAYLEAWSRAGDDRRSGAAPNAANDPEAIAARLRNLRMLCGTIEDIRTLRALGMPEHRAKREGLLAWRGLPISAFTAEWLAGGEEMTRLVAEAATLALDSSPAGADRARTALRRIESENPTRRLVARLDREARERGIVAVPPYASLAAPPTRGAWMAEHRARLAAIARYLDEAAAAAQQSERDAARVMQYVEMMAGEMQ